MNQKRADGALALDQAPELGLRKCAQCRITKPADSLNPGTRTSLMQVYVQVLRRLSGPRASPGRGYRQDFLRA